MTPIERLGLITGLMGPRRPADAPRVTYDALGGVVTARYDDRDGRVFVVHERCDGDDDLPAIARALKRLKQVMEIAA